MIKTDSIHHQYNDR